MDLVVVFLVLCFIAWLRKLDLFRPGSLGSSVGQPHHRVKRASPTWA
jgi:hypothetical protein